MPITVCVLVLVWVTVTAAPTELRCVDRCMDGATHKTPSIGFSRTFIIEDKRIEIYYKAYKDSYIFSVNCHGLRALDDAEFSPLPAFTSLFRVNTVILDSCPPPTGRSYQVVFENFNVSLQNIPPNKGTYLKLVQLPSYPELSESHFIGLEHLTNLTIDNEVKRDVMQPEIYFLWHLRQNLNKLELKGVKHPFGGTSLNQEGTDLVTRLYKNHGENYYAKAALASNLLVHGHKSSI